jgi:hypothetical protein
MNMQWTETMRKLGSLLFVLMWMPFTCIFVGMAAEYGEWGRELVARFPALLTPSEDGLSTLSSVSMLVTFGTMFLAMGLVFGAPLLAGIANRRLQRSGTQAHATIKSAAQTGTYINENPVVRFELEVFPATGGTFDAATEMLVQQVEIPQFQPGNQVAVRYDPVTLEVAISTEPLP